MNPYKPKSETQPFQESVSIHDARVRVTDATNHARDALYAYGLNVESPMPALSRKVEQQIADYGIKANAANRDGSLSDPELATAFHSYEPSMAVAATQGTVPEALNSTVNLMGQAEQREELRMTEQETRVNDALNKAYEIHDEINS